MTSMRPSSWLDRLFGAAVSLLLAALALYVAAQLVLSIWRILVAILVVGLISGGVAMGTRNRRGGW